MKKKIFLRIARVSITRLRINKVVIEKVVQRIERGPLMGILVPTLEHHCVVGVRTQGTRRLGHAIVVFFDFVDDLRMSHAGIWIGTQGDQLIQKYAERPYVRLDGVGAQARVRVDRKDFGRGPFDFFKLKMK